MLEDTTRSKLITTATPLFARKGLHGVSVRELALAAKVNLSLISYYFGSKEGLYAAVIEEQFASLNFIAQVAALDIAPLDKFNSYICQCGICFHEGDISEFTPTTASADPMVPECPRCLNNYADMFDQVSRATQSPSNTMAQSDTIIYKEIVGG